MSSQIFRQVRNDAKNLEAIADGYKTKIEHEHWLVDGLQKDAIQNSWDARIDKKRGNGWECGFGLLNIRNEKVLCIKDAGTSGLNGTKFYSEPEMGNILVSNEKGEDLAYFLNSDWSAKSIEEGGNRGRGKFLFLYASRNKKIFFDSFRSSDKDYLFGEVFLDSDKQIKFKINYREEAKNAFNSFIDGKQTLLNLPGTRIFITNPDPSIEQSIQTGEIFSYISYSRWEIIKKFNAKIFVYDGKEKKYITLPAWYEDKEDNENNKKYELETIKSGTDYKIKRLVLRYAPNLDLPEGVRGIAIQRGGMTIERIKADDLVHEEGMNDIYGWLEMEEKKSLENEMKNSCEGPEHFNFSWTQKPAKYLRDYLRIKIREYAKELKIVSPEQAKRNKIQKIAETEALKSLLPLFKKLELFGKHKGTKFRKKSNRNQNEPLRLSVPDIVFPNENRRVNYGEIIKGVYVIPISDYDRTLFVRVKVYILTQEGQEILIDEKEFNLNRDTKIKIGVDSLQITNRLKQGNYTLKAKMFSLEDTDLVLSDGTKIEESTKIYERVNIKFYVETEPDELGKFPFNFLGIPSKDKEFLFRWESDGDNGYIAFYNVSHPKIMPLLNNEEGALNKYLIEQGAFIAFQIKLEELFADNTKQDKEFSLLMKSKDLTQVWPFYLKKFSEYIWDLNS